MTIPTDLAILNGMSGVDPKILAKLANSGDHF